MNKRTFYKTKIINLDRRTDRWETFIKIAKETDIENYERFSAVDGKELHLTPYLINLFKNNKFRWRRGIIGACLSHYTLWKELVESDIEYYLIFEDDVDLCDNFKHKLDVVIKKLKYKSYPLLLLGYTTDKDYIKDIYKHDTDDIIIYKPNTKAHIWGGIFAYFIHRSFAEKLINKISKNGFIQPADTTILEFDDIYITTPILVQSDYMALNNNIDSDIQYDLLSINDDYDFFSLKDSFGNDICRHNKKSVYELKKLADADDKCVGFNTFGYLKYKINDNLIQLTKITDKRQGLYVKKKKYTNI